MRILKWTLASLLAIFVWSGVTAAAQEYPRSTVQGSASAPAKMAHRTCQTCGKAQKQHRQSYGGERCRVTIRRPPLSRKANGEKRSAGPWCFRDTKTGQSYACPSGYLCTHKVRCGAVMSYCQNYTAHYYLTPPGYSGKTITFRRAGKCVPEKADHPSGVNWAAHQH